MKFVAASALALVAGCGAEPRVADPKLADDVAFKGVASAAARTEDRGHEVVRDAPLPWLSSLSEGRTRARGEKRALVVWLHAEWSVESKRLERDVLKDAEVQRMLAPLVRVKIDVGEGAPEDDGRMAELSVNSVPTLIVTDASGREVGRVSTGAQATRVRSLLRVALEAR